MAESKGLVITNHARERSIERDIDLNLVIAANPPTRKQRSKIALQTEHSSKRFLNKRQYKGRYYLVYKDIDLKKAKLFQYQAWGRKYRTLENNFIFGFLFRKFKKIAKQIGNILLTN